MLCKILLPLQRSKKGNCQYAISPIPVNKQARHPSATLHSPSSVQFYLFFQDCLRLTCALHKVSGRPHSGCSGYQTSQCHIGICCRHNAHDRCIQHPPAHNHWYPDYTHMHCQCSLTYTHRCRICTTHCLAEREVHQYHKLPPSWDHIPNHKYM